MEQGKTTPDDPILIKVHTLTAKVFLNRPIDDLIPARYIKDADKSAALQRNAWVFRSGGEDARQKDLNLWSKVDIRYRDVFRSLRDAPDFDRAFYDNGSQFQNDSLPGKDFDAQGEAMHELLEEILDMLYVRREAGSMTTFFYLRSKICRYSLMNYMTGSHARHHDAPSPSGFLVLEYNVSGVSPLCLIPISTTMQSEPFEAAIEGKVKMILSQLYLHIRALRPRGDMIPDQEIFLLGLHGSRLHILRAFFPGEKTSDVWCGKKGLRRRSPTSPIASTPTSSGEKTPEQLTGGHDIREAAMPTIDYSDVDNEPDLHTFRVLATQEFDLWQKSDFRAAVRALVALINYLMSGRARMGILQNVFEHYPYDEETDEETEEKREEQRKQITEEAERREADTAAASTGSRPQTTNQWNWAGDDEEIDFFEDYAGEGFDPLMFEP